MNHKKRFLAIVMAICMAVTMLPAPAFAEGCEHHPSHTTECGYQEAVTGADCSHECGEDCSTEAGCVHGENHDEACGYAAATEGVDCSFQCDLCGTNAASEDGGDSDPVCTGGMDCTLTEGHTDGCEKAAYDIALADCTKAGDCPASVHHTDCAKDIADKQAAELAKCDSTKDCTAALHQDGCEKGAYEAELAKCTGAEGCEAAAHQDTCPLYVWVCDMTLGCKASDHDDGCEKAAYEAELAKCTEAEECESAVHKESCPLYTWACDQTMDCKAQTHEDGCEKAAYDEELAKCTENDDCEAAVHKNTCPLYVWICDKTEDCKAADHEEDCPAGIKAAAQKIFDEMVAALPAPETFDPLDEEMMEKLDGDIRAIITFALENGLYETQEDVLAHPIIAALLDAMYPKMTVENGYELDYTWYDASATTLSISSVGQLAALAKITRGEAKLSDGSAIPKDNFSGKTVTLTQSVSFADDQYWYFDDGAAKYTYVIKDFAGSFNGGGCTISGLKFKNANSSQNPSLGLFETITAGGSVNNLTVASATAQTNDRDSFGFLARNLYGSASNCHVNGVNMSVTGYYSTCGFLFAYVNSATVSGCSVSNVTFKTTGNDNSDLFGGVIGNANNSTISGCTASNINLTFDRKTKRTGGFIGNSTNTNITDCTAADVNISVGTYYQSVGGFVGQAVGEATYSNCHVNRYVFNTNCTDYAGDVGGFAATTSGTVSFIGCTVTGLSMNLDVPDNNTWGAGGFVGWQTGTVTLSGCSVSGTITAAGAGTNQPTGGMVGVAKGSGLTIDGSSAAGLTISATSAAGGLVGKVSSTNPVVLTNSAAAGSVSTSGAAGGLVGYADANANMTFDDSCVPPASLSGAITNAVANSADKQYSDAEHYTDCSCYVAVSGYNIGYPSIKDALATGAASVTLLKNAAEDFSLNRSITLNLGGFTLDSTVTFPEDAFTANGKDEHQVCQITGIDLTITGTSTGNNILLTAPKLDHHTFLGWCSSETSTPNYDDHKTTGGWMAAPGQTYHGHWQHSTYTELGEALHQTFTMAEGGVLPAAHTVTFQSTDSGAKVTAVNQGSYFDITFSGLDVTITPKTSVQQLTPGNYTDIIHVTVHDGSTHSITATLVILDVFEITFDANGGTPAATTAVTNTNGELLCADGNPAAALPVPVRPGYDFKGWFTRADGDGQEVTSTTFTGDTTLYAHWTVTEYTITYHLDGGSNPANTPATYTVETQSITLPTPTKNLYRFDGWYLENTFQNKVTEIAAGDTGNKVFYARWTQEKYSIIQGAAQTVIKGYPATFTSDAPFGKFVGVQVDGVDVASTSYTAESGSTKVTLKADYIRILSVGVHTLTILSSDGSASTTFTVYLPTADFDSPQTGDTTNSGLWLTLAAIGLLGLMVSLMAKKYYIKRR